MEQQANQGCFSGIDWLAMLARAVRLAGIGLNARLDSLVVQ